MMTDWRGEDRLESMQDPFLVGEFAGLLLDHISSVACTT